MEEIINEQAKMPETESEQKANNNGNEASYGKFKSAEALLSAYNSLEAEFTKRCQRIKELETEKSKAFPENAVTNEAQGISPKDKENILKDYLIEIERGKSQAIVMGGEGVEIRTPYSKPVNFKQAGELAKEILDKK